MTENQRPLILAIDPGPVVSGWVYGDPEDRRRPILAHGITDNQELRQRLQSAEWANAATIVIEEFVSYGRPLDGNSLWTVRWIGRFEEAIRQVRRAYPGTLPRRIVKTILCKNHQAKDPDVTRVLCDIYGPGRRKAWGRKATPGPLYGITDHEWQALGLALAFVWKARIEKAQGKLFEFEPVVTEAML